MSEGKQTDRPTDRQTDRQTAKTYLQIAWCCWFRCVHHHSGVSGIDCFGRSSITQISFATLERTISQYSSAISSLTQQVFIACILHCTVHSIRGNGGPKWVFYSDLEFHTCVKWGTTYFLCWRLLAIVDDLAINGDVRHTGVALGVKKIKSGLCPFYLCWEFKCC